VSRRTQRFNLGRVEDSLGPSERVAFCSRIPYDVAKLLGDTVETVEKHRAPFVRELRERARWIMEKGEGLEITGAPQAQQERAEGKPD
jgi:hypothetical protein